jgi:hypothetical protein
MLQIIFIVELIRKQRYLYHQMLVKMRGHLTLMQAARN